MWWEDRYQREHAVLAVLAAVLLIVVVLARWIGMVMP